MRLLITSAIVSSFLLLGVTKASALTTPLYDGSAGNAPTDQGWARFPVGTQTVGGGGITLSTTANPNIRDGYSRNSPTLNQALGYNLRFDLQLLQEARTSSASNNTAVDNSDDRAGLSILVVSSDPTKAIELGFFIDRIWAQEDGMVKADPTTAPSGTRFTQAEGVAFNTNAAINQYDLSILNNSYLLYANGNYTAPILSGRLRNYTPEAASGGVAVVYATPNYIFVGDNTTSASGEFRLNQVALSDSAITPVPFAFNPLLGFGMFGISRLRQAVRKKATRLKK